MKADRYPLLAGIALVMLATGVAAAGAPIVQGGPTVPGRPAPSTPSEPVPVVPRASEDQPKSRSDDERIVGRVMQIDRERGVVHLDTEEGVLVAPARPAILAAIRVGDTISVPRPPSDSPSASPRTKNSRPVK